MHLRPTSKSGYLSFKGKENGKTIMRASILKLHMILLIYVYAFDQICQVK